MILRFIRSTLATALTWGAAWFGFGVLFRIFLPLERGLGIPTFEMLLWSGLEWVLPGAISGFFFSLLLGTEPSQPLEELSPKRVALWGAIGAALPFVLVLSGQVLSGDAVHWFHLELIAEWSVVGAACAAGSLALARRSTAPGQPAHEGPVV